MSYDDDENLSELAFQALAAHDQERRRLFLRSTSLIALTVGPMLVLLAWFTTAGYQHHVLEIESGGRVFRIVSHKSPFEIYTPTDETLKIKPGGMFAVVTDDFKADRVEARNYEWASYISTRQRVHLPDGMVDYRFYVNTIPFSLTRAELKSGETRWRSAPGETREINVDKLSPPAPEPINAPSIAN